ncbi:hypothetical protein V2J09_004680, partial [Rumex salicifolius]
TPNAVTEEPKKLTGCLACGVRHELRPSSEERHKGLFFQGGTEKTASISGDFWTTSTRDMDNSAVQSQASMSSISTSALEANGGVGSLLLWNQTRQRWVGNNSANRGQQQIQEPKLSWNATYESLLGSNKPFSQPIPLTEMVDFLVDIWEQEGMYD